MELVVIFGLKNGDKDNNNQNKEKNNEENKNIVETPAFDDAPPPKSEEGNAYADGGDAPIEMSPKKPSYQIGQSDGGPGTWENRTTPEKGAAYQEKVTGAPKNTEYVVKTDKMPSGEKKFDGYDPETKTLQDAKDWDKWPPEGQKWAERKIVKEAKNDAAIAQQAGRNLEWHVPTEEKAAQLQDIFDRNNINGINIKVTPK